MGRHAINDIKQLVLIMHKCGNKHKYTSKILQILNSTVRDIIKKRYKSEYILNVENSPRKSILNENQKTSVLKAF